MLHPGFLISDLQPFLMGLLGCDILDSVQDSRQIALPDIQLHHAALDFGHIQHIIDQ